MNENKTSIVYCKDSNRKQELAWMIKHHEAYGLGIYSFFSGEPTISNKVRLENAMEVPEHSGIVLHIRRTSRRNESYH